MFDSDKVSSSSPQSNRIRTSAEVYAAHGTAYPTNLRKHLAAAELDDSDFEAFLLAKANSPRPDTADEAEAIQAEYDRVTFQLDRAHTARRPRPEYIRQLAMRQAELLEQLQQKAVA